MLPDYKDIRSRIDEEPKWFDGNGVPRYDVFTPDMLGVYDTKALLVEIMCQACSQRILVGEGWTRYSFLNNGSLSFPTLEEIATGFQYADPPWHSCKGAGESMNSISVRIVEAWEREKLEWARRPEIEAIPITQDWADDRV